jgi:hypothetical protein
VTTGPTGSCRTRRCRPVCEPPTRQGQHQLQQDTTISALTLNITRLQRICCSMCGSPLYGMMYSRLCVCTCARSHTQFAEPSSLQGDKVISLQGSACPPMPIVASGLGSLLYWGQTTLPHLLICTPGVPDQLRCCPGQDTSDTRLIKGTQGVGT